MATPTSPEASDIRRRGRQRLIGAAVIAILLVVFVPMVLDSEPKTPRSAPALDIPAKDKVAALPAPPAAPTGPAAIPAQPAPVIAKPGTGIPSQDPPKAAPEPPRSASPAAKAATTPPAAAEAPKLEGFAVQVGAFREEDKLKQARDKLTAAGISHFVERRDTPTGPLNRLRAGPYPTRDAAEQALVKVKSASLDGQVVPLP
jgi:DedD protein